MEQYGKTVGPGFNTARKSMSSPEGARSPLTPLTPHSTHSTFSAYLNFSLPVAPNRS